MALSERRALEVGRTFFSLRNHSTHSTNYNTRATSQSRRSVFKPKNFTQFYSTDDTFSFPSSTAVSPRNVLYFYSVKVSVFATRIALHSQALHINGFGRYRNMSTKS